MKIARIESFILGTASSKDLLFCRVETDDGFYGWGEGYVTAGKETVIAECVKAMAPYVIGRSVFNIRHTGQVLFEDFAIRRGSMELLSAWSAIEIASWDIIGKRAGLPVYNLLGGASRERVRIYANGWAGRSTIEEGAERAADILNPDICAIGGITALLDIAAMAQPHAVVMSPHNYNSPLIGMAATVHVSAVIPNFRITEYFVNFEDICRDIAVTGLTVQDGWIDLPTMPGLGIDLDIERLRAHPHQEATKHGFRQYWEEYPRKGYVPKLSETRI